MINLRDNIFTVLLVVALAVTLFMLLRPSQPEIIEVPVKVEVKVPEIKHTTDTVEVPRPVYIHKESKEFRELKERYIAAQDSLEKLNLYLEAITEQQYATEYTDTIQDITVHSRVRGELLEQYVDYTIHGRTIIEETTAEVELKQRIELFGHVAIGLPVYNRAEMLPVAKASLIMRNKRGHLLSLGIDTEGRGWVGYGVKF